MVPSYNAYAGVKQQRVAGKAMMLNNYNPSSYTSDPFSSLSGGYGEGGMGMDALLSSLGSVGSSENKILEF
jgi:hypothetical protein